MSLFKKDKKKSYFDMKVLDLSLETEVEGENSEIYKNIVVDYPEEIVKIQRNSGLYLGHPDSALLDNGDIIVAYPLGHGKGETVFKKSIDGGLTWSDRFKDLPESFKHTLETPTIYKLDFVSGDQKLVMMSARPAWGKRSNINGFDTTVSVSKGIDGKCDGEIWSPHENFYGKFAKKKEFYAPTGTWNAVVAMASLTHLKGTDGDFIDKWMGLFHTGGNGAKFTIYKTYLTFDDNGEMYWSMPISVLKEKKSKKIQSSLQFCEPEVVRSPDGKELAMIYRTQAKKSYSHVSFSTDEGESWSRPQTLSRELTGERHKAEYDPITGKLLISCRNIDWTTDKNRKRSGWISRGWLVWVGDYADLHKGEAGTGDMVVRPARTYAEGVTSVNVEAHADTGYAGLTIDKDGNVVIMSYGKFESGNGDTFIVAKRFKVAELTKLYNELEANSIKLDSEEVSADM